MNSHQQESNSNSNNSSVEQQDDHEYDTVMPGFRFHPTEEELVQFYLRRKVEGKPFNLELITFLDLYRYDPWELPGLAAVGEKEWYFYVPRDRKYRNGDRPNRVTTSGYWKATGADKMITSTDCNATDQNIGLKKTLVFYFGKAPKGTRTSWIMNEYRLPLHETQRLGKAEISLCRVHKRAGVDDPRWPCLSDHRASSSLKTDGKISKASPSSCSSTDIGTPILLSYNHNYSFHDMISPLVPMSVEDDEHTMVLQQSKQACNSSLAPNSTTIFACCSSNPTANNDDLHNLVNINDDHEPQPAVALNVVHGSFQAAAFSDRLWDWNGSKEYFDNLFK